MEPPLMDPAPGIAGLIRAFDTLSEYQRNEALRQLTEYVNGSEQDRERIVNESQSIAKVDLGPLSNVCPFCGR